MSDKLEQAIRELWNIDPSLKPVPYGDAREKAIVAGLHALAGHFGKEIAFTHINARGELAFNLKGAEIGRGGEYGRRTRESPLARPAPHRHISVQLSGIANFQLVLVEPLRR